MVVSLFFGVLLLQGLYVIQSFSPVNLLPKVSRPTVDGTVSLVGGTISPAAQLLIFQEPQTNVTVVLVGSCHYNPVSVRLAADTVKELGKQNKLGSVVVESCDIRWNKTSELYAEKPFLKQLLNNEMRTACDAALSFNRPVVLGDQRINITSDALKESLKQTLLDLVTPPSGWKRFSDEVTQAWEESVPFHLEAVTICPRLHS
jgi:hypothetical protein